MPYLAKVSNTSGAWTVIELRFVPNGLQDLCIAEQASWRLVVNNHPTVDNTTQVVTTPQDLAVSADGATVTMNWNVESTPVVWTKMRLKDYVVQQSTAKANGGLMLPNGVQLATTSDQAGLIIDAIESLERGWISEPVLFQTLNGEWASLGLNDFKAIGSAIAQFKQGIYVARKAVYDAIDAGVITTSAQVDAAI